MRPRRPRRGSLSPRVARRSEAVQRFVAGCKCIDDLVSRPTDIWKDVDSRPPQRRFEGRGDCRTDQEVDSQLEQRHGTTVAFQPVIGGGDDRAILNVNDADRPRDIEHRRHPTVPYRDRDSHGNESRATLMPGRDSRLVG